MNKKHTQKHTNTPHQHTSPTAPRMEKKRSSTRSRRNTTHQNSTGPTHTLEGVREVHFLGVAHVDGFHYLPTQTKQSTIRMEILQNYHTFALFHSPKMGNLLTPAISGGLFER